MSLSRCESEGLSPAQTACILAARRPDWSDQLRACAAFASNPPSWIIVGPTRAERQALRRLPSVPDGPRESKKHYAQLVAARESTCGLDDRGTVECWGRPLAAPFAAGTFSDIALTNEASCGRDRARLLHCTFHESVMDPTPTDAMVSFSIDRARGCGVIASDKSLRCWSIFDGDAFIPPPGQFSSVVVGPEGACGMTLDHAETCFGKTPPLLPAADVLAYSSDGEAGCSVTKTHELACTGTALLGATPAGKFETVALSGDHACATRVDGGTVCWGENDDGACNVPQ